MTKASDNAFPSILITEGTEPSAPAAGKQRLYIDSTTHHLTRTNSSGTETDIESGAGGVASDAIWDAAGDLAVGTGANTAARVGIGTINKVLQSNGTTAGWAEPRIHVTLGPFYLNDIPGTATTPMTLLFIDSATGFIQGGAGASQIPLGTAGRVVGAILTASATRTGGTCTLQVRINGVDTAFNSGAVQINGTDTLQKSSFVTYANGLAFGATDPIKPALVTSSYTLTTTNATAWLVVQLDI